jgi:hypothetical protein
LKGFFKALAVKEMRTFGITLARMIPMHVTTNNLPTYLTEEQIRAELRAPPRGRLAAAEQYHPAGARTQEHVDGVDAVRLWAVTGWLSRLSPARSRAPVRSDPKNVTRSSQRVGSAGPQQRGWTARELVP